MPRYRCAICKRETPYEGRVPDVYPFCSERCRMVDLGLWFRESYAIDRDLTPEDVDSGATAPPGSQERGGSSGRD